MKRFAAQRGLRRRGVAPGEEWQLIALQHLAGLESPAGVGAFGVGINTALNLIVASVADTYPAELRATAVGWCNGIGRIGAIAAPSLGGWVFAAVGARGVFGVLLGTASALTVLLAVVAVAGARTHRLIASAAAPMRGSSAEVPGTPAL